MENFYLGFCWFIKKQEISSKFYPMKKQDEVLLDEQNSAFIFSQTHTELLVKTLKGEIDLLKLIKKALINRGLNDEGQWVGFENAKKLFGGT